MASEGRPTIVEARLTAPRVAELRNGLIELREAIDEELGARRL
jgi:hypothetical protein